MKPDMADSPARQVKPKGPPPSERLGRVARLIAWSRAEIKGLIIFFGLAGLVWGFAEIADEVTEGESRTFDEGVMRAFRTAGDLNDPIGPNWFEIAMKDVTSLGGASVLTLMTVLVVGYLIVTGKRHNAVLVAVAVIGGALLSHFLKLGFDRPRPDLVAKLVEVRTLSFPSGHAMLSAATYLTLGAILASVQKRRRDAAYVLGAAVLLTLVIGTSRTYLGVHWPTDVLAGWCVGGAWAGLCWLVAEWLQDRGTVEKPGEKSAPMSTDDD